VAKQWDERHLKIGQRTGDLAKLAKEKWQEFDEKYQVQQKVGTASKTTVDAVKAFDENYQISRRLSETAKSWDEKYQISSQVQSQVDNIKSNEQVQKVSTKVSEMMKTGLDTFDQLSKETQQLVNEKEASIKTEEQQTQPLQTDGTATNNANGETVEDNTVGETAPEATTDSLV